MSLSLAISEPGRNALRSFNINPSRQGRLAKQKEVRTRQGLEKANHYILNKVIPACVLIGIVISICGGPFISPHNAQTAQIFHDVGFIIMVAPIAVWAVLRAVEFIRKELAHRKKEALEKETEGAQGKFEATDLQKSYKKTELIAKVALVAKLTLIFVSVALLIAGACVDMTQNHTSDVIFLFNEIGLAGVCVAATALIMATIAGAVLSKRLAADDAKPCEMQEVIEIDN